MAVRLPVRRAAMDLYRAGDLPPVEDDLCIREVWPEPGRSPPPIAHDDGPPIRRPPRPRRQPLRLPHLRQRQLRNHVTEPRRREGREGGKKEGQRMRRGCAAALFFTVFIVFFLSSSLRGLRLRGSTICY